MVNGESSIQLQVSLRKKRKKEHREQGNAKAEAETGVINLQAEGHQGSPQNLGERQGTQSPSMSRGTRSYRCLNFRLLASRTVREYFPYTYVVLNHHVGSCLLRQPQETCTSSCQLDSESHTSHLILLMAYENLSQGLSKEEKVFPGHSLKQISWQLPCIVTLNRFP